LRAHGRERRRRRLALHESAFFSGFFFLSTEAIASGVSMRMTTPQPLHAHAMVTIATRK